MDKAFILGAGLGVRLRPLTDRLPKPLVPLFHRPLITYALDHLLEAGLRRFIVNTHHLAHCYAASFPEARYRGAPLVFRHEPVLLETAGGIANIIDLVRDDPFLVYNGDILSDLPLQPLIAAHEGHGHLVTLALRSRGPARHIAFDPARGQVTDIRNLLGTGNPGTFQFTGIYAVSPAFLAHLTPGRVESVIPIFLKLIAGGASIGGVVLDEGVWLDLGNRGSYLDAHRILLAGDSGFPAYAGPEAARAFLPRHPGARIHPTARLLGCTVVGAGCEIGAGAVLEDCILWPGARVAAGSRLARCIVLDGHCAAGAVADADL